MSLGRLYTCTYTLSSMLSTAQAHDKDARQNVRHCCFTAGSGRGSLMHATELLCCMLCCAAGLRLWHKLCVAYEQPRVCAYFRLASPAAGASPAAAVLGALWLRLAEEALTEDAYLAGVEVKTPLTNISPSNYTAYWYLQLPPQRPA